MAYEKQIWEARQGTGLRRFIKTQETGDAVNLTNEPLVVTTPGTPFSVERMNHIEQGIKDAHDAIAEETQARQQSDNALEEAVSAETHARQQADTETLEEAKAYADDQIADAVTATQTWLPSVNTITELPEITDTSRTYLCKARQEQIVYQCVAGQTGWTPYDDRTDLVNEDELEEAVGRHNENWEAHENRFAQVIHRNEKNVPNGVLGLDENGMVPLNRLPGAAAGELGDLFELIEGLADRFFPIGTIYKSAVNRNPAEFIGGTWTVWGSGRVPVGVDTTQTEFETVEKTGGTKTHTLTSTQMPSHTHTQTSHSHSISAYRSGGSSSFYINVETANTGTSYPTTSSSVAPTINSTGGSGSHNNLQPYITCYMWKRTG